MYRDAEGLKTLYTLKYGGDDHFFLVKTYDYTSFILFDDTRRVVRVYKDQPSRIEAIAEYHKQHPITGRLPRPEM